MDIASLLALPGESSFQLQVGPRFDMDVVNISIPAWERCKDEFKKWVCDLPEIKDKQAVSYRVLAQHTGGNRTFARILIALGDLEGLWTFYPNRDIPALWTKSNMYPMILSGSFNLPDATKVAGRVPKPSAGDLEPTEGFCESCEQPMGPAASRSHDRTRWGETKVCNVCVNEGVDPYDVTSTRHMVKQAEEYGRDPLENVEPIQPHYEELNGYLDSFE